MNEQSVALDDVRPAKSAREMANEMFAAAQAARSRAADEFKVRFLNTPLNKLWQAMDVVYPSRGSHEFWAGKSKGQIAHLWAIDPLLSRVTLDMIEAALK